MQSVEDVVTASLCPEVRAPGQFQLGKLQRGDGILGAVVPFSGSLNRSLEVPGKFAQIKRKEKENTR